MTKKSKRRAAARKPQTKKEENVSAIGRALRLLGGAGGGALGAYAGNPVAGTAVGSSLGAALSKWMGFGDYIVKENSVVKRASTGIPMMHKEGQSVVLRHREFIAQVRGSQGFAVQDSFQLNPGNVKTFPWLSSIASSFQEYKFRGLVFHYIPSSGSAVASTNAALGTVMLQTSYRSNDTAPTSKSELLNEYWSGESVPNDTFAHPVECDPAENPFNVQYVRSDEVPTNDSQLLYDLGVTHLCVAGQQADGYTLGDLWVTYEVELKKPIVASNVTSQYQITSTQWTSPTATAIFAGASIERGNLLLTGSATGSTLTLGRGARGRFLCSIVLLSTSGLTCTWSPTVTLTNATKVSVTTDLLNNVVATSVSTGVKWPMFQFGFDITDPTLPVVMVVNTPALTGTLDGTQVNITPY